MSSPYEKAQKNLKRILTIKDLISQGLAKPEEKQEAFNLAKETGALFSDEILKRKADKQSKITVWSAQTRDGYVSASEHSQLDGWIALIQEYLEARKIKTDISNDKTHIQSIVDGEDQHIFITEKGSKEHAHLIVDGGTGEIRVDPKDQAPHTLIKSMEAKLELQNGDVVQVTKSALSFAQPNGPKPDVRAYTSNKDSYFVLEVYNSGDDDLEDFVVTAYWNQPEGPQERVLTDFNEENDYLVMAHPKKLNMLKIGTRVYSHIPSISTDGKIIIRITCKGMKSGLTFEKEFGLETKNKYPAQ